MVGVQLMGRIKVFKQTFSPNESQIVSILEEDPAA